MTTHNEVRDTTGSNPTVTASIMGTGIAEPIAVVGFSLSFPQDIKTPDDLWDTMIKRRSTATPFPKNRINTESIYHPDASRKGQIAVKRSHFLTQDLAEFDAAFFAVSASDAAAMDPQQRLILESTYQALENAGMPMEHLSGSNTSVYTGNFMNDWLHLAYKDGETMQTSTLLGVQSSVNANRVSWFFNLKGNSVNLDTACSSSLVCLDSACQSLRLGNENMSIVAGANVILSPDTLHALSNLNMLSPDGQCYSFDSRANGYSKGEGVAVLVLKRVSDAIRDHDTIRGIIRSTGCNQDGRTPGITVPSSNAQEELIKETYRKAGLSMSHTRYVEAHGTGTPVGDPIECRAMGSAFRRARSKDDALWVGALKSNIGHLEGASGIAGVIKAMLVLERGVIPPNANFENPNHDIDSEYLRIKFPLNPMPWPTQGLRRASVNSFGNAGTNAHVILDDVFHFLDEAGLTAAHLTTKTPPSLATLEAVPQQIDQHTTFEEIADAGIHTVTPKLLVFSANDAEGTRRIAKQYAAHYRRKLPFYDFNSNYLKDLAYTLSTRRSSLNWKSCALIRSLHDLPNLDTSISTSQKSLTDPHLAFLFTGQGAQWAGMAQELTHYPIFRQSLIQSQEHLTKMGCSWTLDEEIFDVSSSRLSSAEISQPTCTAVQVALVDLLDSFGIYPTAVIGHSSGEIAAAYCTGSISHRSAMRIAYYRGQLTGSLTTTTTSSKGGMMAVSVSAVEILPFLQKIESIVGSCSLAIACVNSSRSITISGPEAQIQILRTLLENEQIFARVLPVNVAYHSRHIESIAGAYLATLQGLEPGISPKLPVLMVSSVTGKRISNSETLMPDYWVRNLISPVMFADAVTNLFLKSKRVVRKKLDLSHLDNFHIDMAMEIGPHAALRRYFMDTVSSTGEASVVKYVPTLLRNQAADETLLKAIGQVVCLGYRVYLEAVNCPSSGPVVHKVLSDLPAYEFNHSNSYWDDTRISKAYRTSPQRKLDLLGKPVLDWNNLEPRWRHFLRASEMPWVEEHVVNGSLIYPGAGMLVMAIEAASQLSSAQSSVAGFEFQEVAFLRPLEISRDLSGTETHFSMRLHPDDTRPLESWSQWRLFAYKNDAWCECSHGMIRVRYDRESNDVDGGKGSREAMTRKLYLRDTARLYCRNQLDIPSFYDNSTKSGLYLGPPFQRILSGAFDEQNHVIASLAPFQWPSSQFPQPHIIHPTTLDCIFHLCYAGPTDGGIKRIPTMIPTYLRSLFVSKGGLSCPESDEVEECAKWNPIGDREADLDAFVLDKSGERLLTEFSGLRMAAIAQKVEVSLEDSSTKLLPYHVEYHPDPTLIDQSDLQRMLKRTPNPDPNSLGRYIDLLVHKKSGLDVLAVSAGMDFRICQALKSCWTNSISAPSFCRSFKSLCLATSSELARSQALQDFGGHPALTTKVIDCGTDLMQQSFTEAAYDLVLLFPDPKVNGILLEQLQSVTKPDGHLIHLIDENSTGIQLPSFPGHGFTVPKLTLCDDTNGKSLISEASAYRKSIKHAACEALYSIYLVTDPTSDKQSQVAGCLASFFDSQGVKSVQVINLEDACVIRTQDDATFIMLLEVDRPILYALSSHLYKTFQQFLTSANNIVWLNLAGGSDASMPEYALVNGLARALRSEHDQLRFAIVSLAEVNENLSESQLRSLKRVTDRNHTASYSAVEDVEYVEIDGLLHVPRIVPALEVAAELAPRSVSERAVTCSVKDAPPLTLSVGSLGLLDTIRFIEDTVPSQPLAADEVEIEVKAIGINFRDCLIALGRLSGHDMGQECAGTVIQAGTQTDFRKGDRVLMISSNVFKTVARSKSISTFNIPDSLPYTVAASFPAQFATSWVAIHEMARLRANETILIHVGASGTGQAAIQIAQREGATIYTTVGSKEKKNLLMKEYDIPEERIFFSRDASFATGIKQITKGRGVDVVINSLAGDLLIASWECVAPHGRFVEIGKKDIMANSKLPMLAFQKNASFQAFDHAVYFQERQQQARMAMEDLIRMFAKGIFRPAQPLKVRELSQVREIFQTIQAGTEPGKFVIEVQQKSEVPALLSWKPTYNFSTDASYVIAGGLGGIGRATARWLATRGARNLILLSRFGPKTREAHQLLDELRCQGVRVETPACDITDPDRMREVFGTLELSMPPVKGCVQASVVAKDCLFDELKYEDWRAAVDCKVIGSWNLHENLPSGMDFYILLSSASGLAGLKGQTNYDAANTYQDALARYRVAHGEKATVFDLGAMVDDGILAEDPNLLRRVLAYGSLQPITRQRYLAMLDYYCDPQLPLLTATECQVAIGLSRGNGDGLEEDTQGRQPMLQPLDRMLPDKRNSRDSSELSSRQLIAQSTSFDAAVQIVTQAVIAKLSKSLSSMQDLTSVEMEKPLATFGVDSLLAIELRNWVVREFATDVAVFEVQGASTLSTLSLLVAGRTSIGHPSWGEADE